MVFLALLVGAELDGLTNLQPRGGCDDPSYPYYFKCKLCSREGSVVMIPGQGTPLTAEQSQKGEMTCLMVFECRGYEPIEFAFGNGWKAESVHGTPFDIDLSEGEFDEYDEKGRVPCRSIQAAVNIQSGIETLIC
ncbi:hypothetical protein CFC21_047238 [Triticum aestivum]|uniref:Uncharacterized protein n=2 Tax=Triticum aestivum TaxID=4565 RepID=A0A9R1K0S2_WHEAT|nr:hypothetical protein CFC21_047238 [Triticum aestivum]